MAEGQGFEPWEVLPSLVFKTSAFDHSATPPRVPDIGAAGFYHRYYANVECSLTQGRDFS